MAAHVADLSVPRDLSIIVITEGIQAVLGIRPAQMRLHAYGMGWLAFGQLQQKMQHPRRRLAPLTVYSTFEHGQTLAPAPRSEEKSS